MPVVSGGSNNGDGPGPGPRRLIVFNPNRILNTQSGPVALKELEKKVREWSPKFCFLSGSSAENPTRQTWEEMKKVIPDLDRNCRVVNVASERIPMAISYLEVLLEEHLSGVSDMQCMTIMVMTISPDPEFRRFVGSLVGAHNSDLKLSSKALAVLESKEPSYGWSEAQDLQEDGWNLDNFYRRKSGESGKVKKGGGGGGGRRNSEHSEFYEYYAPAPQRDKTSYRDEPKPASKFARKMEPATLPETTLDYLRSCLGKPHREDYDNSLEWGKALKEEDCVRLKHLVEEARKEYENAGAEDGVRHGKELLRKGRNEYKVGPNGTINWQEILPGRTAVHAAARRGDLKFLEFIVNEILHGDGYCSIHCNVLKLRDNMYMLDALALAVANGNQKIISFLRQTSKVCDYDPYDVKLDLDDGSADSVPPGEDGKSTAGQPKELDGASMAGLPREPAPREEDGESTVGPSGVHVFDQLEGKLKNITKLVLSEKKSSLARSWYYRDKDFNFLDINVYFFHFTFSTWEGLCAHVMRRIREGIFSQISQAFQEKELLKYLLHLKDGQGRTPLHVAVDSNRVKEFLDLLPSQNKDKDLFKRSQDKFGDLYDLIEDILNAQDEAGRTPLYRAAAKNQEVAVQELLGNDKVNVNARMFYRAGEGGTYLNLDRLSMSNGFQDCFYIREEKSRNKVYKRMNAQRGRDPNLQLPPEVSSSVLHIAIILKHQKVVEAIVRKLLLLDNRDSGEDSEDIWCHRRFSGLRVAGKARENADISIYGNRISTMKLAVLIESIPILQTLLKAEDRKPGLFTSQQDERELPSFHLAAAVGNVEVVKAFLDSKQGDFDPTQVDRFHNTALHHALKGTAVTFFPHVVDFVGCDYIPVWLSANHDDWTANHDDWTADPLEEQVDLIDVKSERMLLEQSKIRDVRRKLSIDLLLQVGVNIWEKNKFDMTANPFPNASDEFTKWWYEKTAEETKQAQEKLNAAANAISVTAALVATASYVGPVQPPLGYGTTDSIQENILAVRIYVACDSLSFYLALGAIMLALLPALPLPQASVFRELARTRLLIAVAVTFLFPSIVCILLAFASGYIAVIPDHGLAYHGFLVATTVFGGLLCLLVMIVFLDRLRRVVITLPRDVWKEIGLLRLVGLFPGMSRSSDQSIVREEDS